MHKSAASDRPTPPDEDCLGLRLIHALVDRSIVAAPRPGCNESHPMPHGPWSVVRGPWD
jgi:hypothetical protein